MDFLKINNSKFIVLYYYQCRNDSRIMNTITWYEAEADRKQYFFQFRNVVVSLH